MSNFLFVHAKTVVKVACDFADCIFRSRFKFYLLMILVDLNSNRKLQTWSVWKCWMVHSTGRNVVSDRASVHIHLDNDWLTLKVDFHCRFFLRAYARKWNRGNVWKATRKRISWARFFFFVYAWPSIHCLYSIYACKNYATVEIHL